MFENLLKYSKPNRRCQPISGTGSKEENCLTLIPPSGGLYDSQLLAGKLFEVHKGYENETIIYSSSFLC
jgi:hypothetical protein